MISRTSIFLVAFLGFFSAVYSNVKCPGKAEYELSVWYMWNNISHPNAFPMDGKFSPLIGCSHNSDYNIFMAGMMATKGVEDVAETGNFTTLKTEIMKQIMYNKTAWKTFYQTGGPVNGSAHVTGLKVYVTADYYKVSAISMLVPSPDWFVGVPGVSLCDNGMWKDSAEVMSQAWDAGTEDGTGFDTMNAATNPTVNMAIITKADDTPFKGPNDIKPFAKFMLKRVNKPAPPTCSGEKKYTLKFEGMWAKDKQSSDFPGNAHFTKLIGCTHMPTYKFWSPMTMASAGVKSVAETGNPDVLKAELDAVKAKQNSPVLNVYQADGSTDPTATRSMEIVVKDGYACVSIITMIAPSPDWFVGIDCINLCGSNGWEKSKEMSLAAWDGGSDSGAGFTSTNNATMPQSVVELLTGPNAKADYAKITITMGGTDSDDNAAHRPSSGIFTLLAVACVTILRFMY